MLGDIGGVIGAPDDKKAFNSRTRCASDRGPA
jgi:hypothetical protein